jgi:hypothetical protein
MKPWCPQYRKLETLLITDKKWEMQRVKYYSLVHHHCFGELCSSSVNFSAKENDATSWKWGLVGAGYRYKENDRFSDEQLDEWLNYFGENNIFPDESFLLIFGSHDSIVYETMNCDKNWIVSASILPHISPSAAFMCTILWLENCIQQWM